MMLQFTKSPVALDSLSATIRSSNITVALDYIEYSGTTLKIYFKAALSVDEQSTLSGIVAAHDGVPLPENTVAKVDVQSLPEPPPFATPSYRTKRKGGPFVTIAPGATQIIDFPLTEERYTFGGLLVHRNSEVGDTLTAEVIDNELSPVIPVPYRPVLCEEWPLVVRYIEDEPVPPGNGGREINTYPLNAKISPGLILRVKYTACNEGSDRKVGIGYYLTKRLV